MEEKKKKQKVVNKEEKDACRCHNCECEHGENEKCNCGENCNCGEECNCNCNEKDKYIEELETKLKSVTDFAARTQAEMINFKKRKEEETANMLKYCNEDILLRFVEICDNFERAIKMDDDNLTDEVSKFLEGFKIMYTHMVNVLESNEVKEIEVLGKPFDPNTSEAVIVEHTEDKEHNEVVEVLRKGYTYKDKLLRPAMVKIND